MIFVANIIYRLSDYSMGGDLRVTYTAAGNIVDSQA